MWIRVAAYTAGGLLLTFVLMVLFDGLISRTWEAQHLPSLAVILAMSLCVLVNLWGSILLVKLNSMKKDGLDKD